MTEPNTEVVTRASHDRRLGYSSEFRKELKEHPGIINTARQLISQGEANYDPPNFMLGLYEIGWDKEYKVWEELSYYGKLRHRIAPDIPNMPPLGRGTFLRPGNPEIDAKTGLEITVLGISNRQFHGEGGFGGSTIHAAGVPGLVTEPARVDRTTYLKAQVGDRSYFIKKSTKTNNPGAEEFLNTRSAEEALKGLDFVSVAQAQLGYQDANESWYISDWKDLETEGFLPYDIYIVGGVADSGQLYLRNKDPFLKEVDTKKVEQQVEQIEDRLREQGISIRDTGSNFYYNYKTGKFFLLDITTS